MERTRTLDIDTCGAFDTRENIYEMRDSLEDELNEALSPFNLAVDVTGPFQREFMGEFMMDIVSLDGSIHVAYLGTGLPELLGNFIFDRNAYLRDRTEPGWRDILPSFQTLTELRMKGELGG